MAVFRGRASITGFAQVKYVENVTNSVALGDVNNDISVDLADAVLLLKVLFGMDTGAELVEAGADVNGDGRIGLEDAIYC